jgi:hypothetical protein
MKILLPIAIALTLLSCGEQNASHMSGIESEDPVTAQFRGEFQKAKTITSTLEGLQVGRSMNCALQEGIKGEFRTGTYSQKFTRFANLAKSEIVFDDLAELQTFTNDKGKGLMTQINGVPNHMVSNPVEIYFRTTAEGYLVQEWTVHPWEYLSKKDQIGRTTLSAANSVLDRSIASPERYVLFYGFCE